MKSVTKNNMIKYIEMKKRYMQTLNKELLNQINDFTENVINTDKSYYSKLTSYKFSSKDLNYCLPSLYNNFSVIKDKIDEKEKRKDLFYYELESDANGKIATIEKKAVFCFAGTLIADFDVLHGRPFAYYNEFLKEMNYI